ncbi:VIR protein [Plasmodium vivax]|uniref:VIR protein n=1 Tax=Plasmodium vivax TaxID=5855 RepID=A0A1G4E8S1_PLAVI|nr:VIR protein [Plasmodium vivax]
MPCSSSIGVDNYDFFDNIITYLEKEGGVKVDGSELNKLDDCDSFSNIYTPDNMEAGKYICKLFIKLYTSLNNVKNERHEDYKKEWHFLNYWLNNNLSKTKLNKTTCATEFTEGFSNHCAHTFLNFDFPPDLIYNIREEDLNKMNLLYGLYEDYRKLNNILTTIPQGKPDLLLEPSTKCCSDYIKANYFCKGENSKFCTQLGKFKKMYEDLYPKLDGKSDEYTNSFKRLTQCDNNTMSTALVGTTVGLVPLLVGLYKFTPLRQLINSNKGKLTQEYRNNDDEMRNIMLMGHESENTSSPQGIYNIKYHSV